MDNYLPILITAIISPLILKVAEFILNKSSEQSKHMITKVEALSIRVDELKEKNIRQEIEIGVLKAQLLDRDRAMMERDRLMMERDRIIVELRNELDLLRDQKGHE